MKEYLKEDDKIKETNDEVARNLVYQLFGNLEIADFEGLNDLEANSIGSLKVYYGSHDYLERHFDQETLKKSNELKEVIISLLEFVDNINEWIFWCCIKRKLRFRFVFWD